MTALSPGTKRTATEIGVSGASRRSPVALQAGARLAPADISNGGELPMELPAVLGYAARLATVVLQKGTKREAVSL